MWWLVWQENDPDLYKPPAPGVPVARFYLAHALFQRGRLPEASEAIHAYLADVAADGPQKILNMPSGMYGGKQITDVDRAASRFRVRAASVEAQGDAHTMLAIIAEREGGPSAAIPHFHEVLAIAGGGKPTRQIAEAHENLAKMYELSKDDEARAKHEALAKETYDKVVAAEEEEAKKKAHKVDEEVADKEEVDGGDGAAADHLPELPDAPNPDAPPAEAAAALPIG